MRLEEEIKQVKFMDEWHKLSVNIVFTYSWAKEKLQSFFKEFGVTMQQFNVLRILRGQYPNPVSTSDIRERLLDKMSDTPRIVDRLLKENLVSKTINKSDKRLIDVVITEKGLELLKKIDVQFEKITADYKNLNENEAVQLNGLLDKLRG